MTEDEKQSLRSAYNAAWKRVQGSSGKQAQGIESSYGQAYQQLVKAGLAPQIKKKYRYGM